MTGWLVQSLVLLGLARHQWHSAPSLYPDTTPKEESDNSEEKEDAHLIPNLPLRHVMPIVPSR